MEASACPRCALVLKISVIEPHPTRNRVDVVRYRCPIHGDVWRSVVVNQPEAASPNNFTMARFQKKISGPSWRSSASSAFDEAKHRMQAHSRH